MNNTIVLGLSLALITAGCAGNVETESSTTANATLKPASTDALTADGHELPPSVATVALKNGNTVDIYDAKIGALVITRGEADVNDRTIASIKSIVDAHHGADHLVDLYSALQPDQAVPQALIELQDRLTRGKLPELTQPADVGSSNDGATTTAPQVETNGVVSGVANALAPTERTLIGCSNGCCDPQWTYDTVCSGGYSNHDWRWYDFNYGWTSVNTGSGTDWGRATVCAATGTTSWTWGRSDTCGGVQYHWSVPEGYYSSASYSAGWACFSGEMWSKTNSATYPHLHTHCGGADY